MSDDPNGFKPMKVAIHAAEDVFEDEDGDGFDDSDDEETIAEMAKSKERMEELAGHAINNRVLTHDCPSDAWGCLLFVIVKDMGDLMACEVSPQRIFRMVFSFVALFVNLALQGAILYWVFEFVLSPDVARIQSNYGSFHAECFDKAGVFNVTRWDKDFSSMVKDQLCHSALSQPAFLFGILFLWTLAMLAEFRENLRLHRHIKGIPALPPAMSGADQVIEVDNGDFVRSQTLFVVALSPNTRRFIYLLIIIPKYLIVFILTFIGWKWLSASENLSDLILNALALQFVVSIDDLMFYSVFPERMAERVAALKLAIPAPDFDTDEDRETAQNHEICVAYVRSVVILGISLGLLWVYFYFFFDLIPGYDGDLASICAQFYQSEKPSCGLRRKGCFPMGGR